MQSLQGFTQPDSSQPNQNATEPNLNQGSPSLNSSPWFVTRWYSKLVKPLKIECPTFEYAMLLAINCYKPDYHSKLHISKTGRVRNPNAS
jgi:predicted MarR family transcription regulator